MGTGFTQSLMSEEGESRGVIPQAIEAIFTFVKENKNKEIILHTSALEIYHEDLRDLLDENLMKTLSIKENPKLGVHVDNLKQLRVESASDLYSSLEMGGRNRTTNATMMNNTSSRSHAIVTVYMEIHSLNFDENKESPKDKDDDTTNADQDEFLCGKFHFVDLAGSERLKKTGAVGQTMKEGIAINKGLLTLGNVINSLVENKGHVP